MRRRAFVTVLSGAAVIPWYQSGGAVPSVVYKPKGAASLAASYVNLVNPGTTDLTVTVGGGAPDLSADGWVFGGGVETDCLTCALAVSETNCWVARVSTTGAGGGNLGRLFNVTDTFFCYPNSILDQFSFVSGGANFFTTKITTAKTVVIIGKDVYIDGVLAGSAGAGSASASSFQIGNRGASLTRCLQGTISHFAVYASLTEAQMTAITNSINGGA